MDGAARPVQVVDGVMDGRLGPFSVEDAKVDAEIWASGDDLSLTVVSRGGDHGSVMSGMVVRGSPEELQEPGNTFRASGVACAGNEPHQWEVDSESEDFWMDVVERTDRTVVIRTGGALDNGFTDATLVLRRW